MFYEQKDFEKKIAIEKGPQKGETCSCIRTLEDRAQGFGYAFAKALEKQETAI